MKEVSVTLPDLLILRNLRTVVGVGFGLLLANRLSASQRRAAGWAAMLSAISIGIPYAYGFISKLRSGSGRAQLPQPTPSAPPPERYERAAEAGI